MSSLSQTLATHLQLFVDGRVEPSTVVFEDHPGAFDNDEIKRISRLPKPIVFVSLVAFGEPRQKGQYETPRFALNVFVQGAGERRNAGHTTRGDIAEAIVLGIKQALADPHLFAGVDSGSISFPAYYAGEAFGRPERITAQNLYSGTVDRIGLAWWRVSVDIPYTQQVGSFAGELNAWDTLSTEWPKADWREGVEVDDDDPTLTDTKDMSP